MSDSIEAEIVPSQALAVRPTQSQALAIPSIADLEQSFAVAVRQRQLIQQYIESQLKPQKHFYRVRKDKDAKPSLTKEGAELILLPHGLIPDYEFVSGPNEPPEQSKPYQIMVKCILRPKGNPQGFAGSAIGSASSFITSRHGKQPRQNDPGLCHNATLKMAQKSALIAAVLNSTAASEFFTQDMEDIAGVGQDQPQEPPPDLQPSKPATKPTAKRTVSKDDTLNLWLGSCKSKFLELTSKPPILAAAWQYAVQHDWILETERLDSVRPTKMFPNISADMPAEEMKSKVSELHKAIMDGIHAIVDSEPNGDWQSKFTAAYVETPQELPSESEQNIPEEPPNSEGETKMGEIVAVSVKNGQSSRGKWTCYGIKIGEDWFNTFDTKLGKQLEARKNQYVTIEFETTERGKTVLKLL